MEKSLGALNYSGHSLIHTSTFFRDSDGYHSLDVSSFLQIYTLASPCWVCNGDNCEPRGIYDACGSTGSRGNNLNQLNSV